MKIQFKLFVFIAVVLLCISVQAYDRYLGVNQAPDSINIPDQWID